MGWCADDNLIALPSQANGRYFLKQNVALRRAIQNTFGDAEIDNRKANYYKLLHERKDAGLSGKSVLDPGANVSPGMTPTPGISAGMTSAGGITPVGVGAGVTPTGMLTPGAEFARLGGGMSAGSTPGLDTGYQTVSAITGA